MDTTQFSTIVIDCDGVLVNHCQGILGQINELQQNLPQEIPFQQSLIQQYLNHYYSLSSSLDENGFCASHCFTFQTIMSGIGIKTSWKKTFQFGRNMRYWPIYEDSYGALQYFKKFFRVFVRCDREPEDVARLIKNLGIEHSDIIIRDYNNQGLKNELLRKGEDIESCLLITTPRLAELTEFPNIQVIRRSTIFSHNDSGQRSLARLVFDHQDHLRS